MINHKGSFYLGVFVFVIPFLGFPTIWKMGFVLFAGILLILTSIKIPTPGRILRNRKQKNEIEIVPETQQSQIIESTPIVFQTINPKPEIQHTKVSAVIKKASMRGKKVDSVHKPKI